MSYKRFRRKHHKIKRRSCIMIWKFGERPAIIDERWIENLHSQIESRIRGSKTKQPLRTSDYQTLS